MKNKVNLSLIITIFLLVNIIFNFNLWQELFSDKITMTDNIITEYLVETSYQKILHFENPFITKSIFYPFTTNFSISDSSSAYVFPFLFLRPFLDPHRSILIITLFSFFLNNLIMYLLLKKLKINEHLSVIMALVFGFTPFLSHRVLGHYSYTHIYVFPLIFLLIKSLFEPKKIREKILVSLFLGLSMGLILLSNLYYFFMIVLGLIFFTGYWFFTNRKAFVKELVKNVIFIVMTVVSMVFIMIPWMLSVFSLIKIQGLSKIPGFGGAIALSADIVSFFTPSEYNPLYKFLFNKLALTIPFFYRYNNFFLESLERFAYPGMIIVGGYFFILLLKIFRKLPVNLWIKIKPCFTVSLFFAVLMLGPFLKVFNQWSINFDGVSVLLPLPFLLLRYLPGLSTIRAPSRFTPIFVFLACIVTAYLLDFLIEKIGKKKSLIVIIFLFIIFFLDQFYVIPTQLNQTIPKKIYSSLKNQPQGTVLEIPFTVRDGFQYFGFVHAVQPMVGQLIHGKPIIGGYLARVPNEIFNYYRNIKLIGYIGKIIDKGNYVALKEKPGEINFFTYPYTINTAIDEVQSLNIKYVILKDDEKYSDYLKKLFMKISFSEKQKENNYILLEKD